MKNSVGHDKNVPGAKPKKSSARHENVPGAKMKKTAGTTRGSRRSSRSSPA